MKRILLTAILCSCASLVGYAQEPQQTASDAPSSKEDIQKYLDVIHAREMTAKMMDVMAKQQHQLMHEQFLKMKDRLPPNFEEHANKMIDDMLKSFPWDEMLQAMVPVYQKHFTKGEVDALIAFYSTPIGQKVLRELPAVTAEATQAVLPLLQKQMNSMTERVQQEVAQTVKDSSSNTSAKPQQKPH